MRSALRRAPSKLLQGVSFEAALGERLAIVGVRCRKSPAFQEALGRLMDGRTCVIVAHRLSTARNADRIIVLDRGCIAEAGTHEAVDGAPCAYHRLVKN